MELIRPDWPAPANVQAFSTTRLGGASTGPYASLNLGDHVGDEAATVQFNRRLLVETGALPSAPLWLTQVHGVDVVNVSGQLPDVIEADAGVATAPGQVCAVMTADCLPVLLTNKAGDCVAAAHAGWRGLAAGVLPSTLTAMAAAPDTVMAWLGPAIGPQAFQVGDEVRETFVSQNAQAAGCFMPDGDRWLADIYGLARLQLRALGVEAIYGGGLCTFTDARRFFSYRRDLVCGRMASLIWLA